MSDPILHECGIGMVRLLKPLEYYYEKYGSHLWGLNKIYLLMQKQHNRGQDACGLGCVKFDMPVGQPYMFRERSVDANPLEHVFKRLFRQYHRRRKTGRIKADDVNTYKNHFPFAGETYLAHLRYGTHGNHSIHSAHPVIRRNNWTPRNVLLAGNFNMTNTTELVQRLIDFGQHPIVASDTQTILEQIAYGLDEAYDKLRHELQTPEFFGLELTKMISEKLDLAGILEEAASHWDGGYVIGGLIGNGDSFVVRDPAGIRPCWYLQNDEIIAVASERAALQTVFNAKAAEVTELAPGHALTIKRNGLIEDKLVHEPQPLRSCSFERIYFSRANDPDIYRERKSLGAQVKPQILDAINHDLEHSVFGYIPNSGEIAYMGMVEALKAHTKDNIKEAILYAQRKDELTEEKLNDIMRVWPRIEKVAIKDLKLRTFISRNEGRNDLVSHVYDVTHGVVNADDYLVVLDDSIVRGTTLRESILRMLARMNPRKIIVVSSAPQIRYPDCYGIDMSTMGEFIAFSAAIALLQETDQESIIKDVYQACKQQLENPSDTPVNEVKRIYEPFTYEQVTNKITELVTPKNLDGWKGEIQIIFQTLEGLKKAVPDHTGDWYFTGDFPTKGGFRVVNRAFVNYYEKNEGRSY